MFQFFEPKKTKPNKNGSSVYINFDYMEFKKIATRNKWDFLFNDYKL